MKTIITLSNPMVAAKDGNTYRDERVIYGNCKSIPPHQMDCQRAIYVSFWEEKKTLDEALDNFKRRLRETIYENPKLEIEIIDQRPTHLQHRDMY